MLRQRMCHLTGRESQTAPALAQRIIAITDEGDRGLIALQACQAYVRALNDGSAPFLRVEHR